MSFSLKFPLEICLPWRADSRRIRDSKGDGSVASAAVPLRNHHGRSRSQFTTQDGFPRTIRQAEALEEVHVLVASHIVFPDRHRYRVLHAEGAGGEETV